MFTDAFASNCVMGVSRGCCWVLPPVWDDRPQSGVCHLLEQAEESACDLKGNRDQRRSKVFQVANPQEIAGPVSTSGVQQTSRLLQCAW